MAERTPEIEAMLMIDRIGMCGKKAREDFQRLCRERGINDNAYFISQYTPEHLEVAKEVLKLWHTSDKFKVGDKVHVVPLTPTTMPYCIRAVVTEVDAEGRGYFLRAFSSDLPGIYMFNIWDKDLELRVGKARKPTPPELFLE